MKSKALQALVWLAVASWLGRFYYSSSLGFYAEDFNLFEQGLSLTSPAQLIQAIFNNLLSFGQGRPVYYSLLYIYTAIANKFGGMFTLYLICFLILTLNGFLLYCLVRRISGSHVVGLISGLAFCLFPADTTQAWTSMNMLGQSSLTFLLLGLLLYQAGKHLPAYALALASLLCYETAFPIFLAAPLLREKWDKRLIRDLIRHAIILFLLLAFAVIMRKLTGESRVSGLSFAWALRKSLGNMVLGPLISFATFFYRPIKIFSDPMPSFLFFWPVSFAVAFWGLRKLFKLDSFTSLTEENTSAGVATVDRARLRQVALIGLAMVILAYALTLNPNPYYAVQAIFGRNSRVHLSAAVGAAILFGCLWSGIVSWLSSSKLRQWAMGGLAFLFAGLVSFGLVIQQDMKLDWQYQQQFWSDIIRLIPDIADGDVLILDTGVVKRQPAELGNSLSSRVLQQLYHFPPQWQQKPRLYVAVRDIWKEEALGENQIIKVQAPHFLIAGYPPMEVASNQAIILEVQGGKLARRTEPLTHQGQTYPLKPVPETLGILDFPPGPLHKPMIQLPYVTSGQN